MQVYLRFGAVVAALSVAALCGASAQEVPQVELDRKWPQATKLAILAAVFVVILFTMHRVRLTEVLRTVLIWGAIGLGLIALYAYRVPLERAGREVVAVLIPGMAVNDGDEVIVRRGYGGGFVVRGAVDDTDVDFVFDTGASLLVLSSADGRRAGFDPAALDYKIPVLTAAGMTMVAPVRLPSVRVGTILRRNVRGAIAREGDLERSLLGLTFLDTLSGYHVQRDRLVLTP